MDCCYPNSDDNAVSHTGGIPLTAPFFCLACTAETACVESAKALTWAECMSRTQRLSSEAQCHEQPLKGLFIVFRARQMAAAAIVEGVYLSMRCSTSIKSHKYRAKHSTVERGEEAMPVAWLDRIASELPWSIKASSKTWEKMVPWQKQSGRQEARERSTQT